MDKRLVVLDASVGVKWFAPEAGHDVALDLLRASASGSIVLVVPDLFVYEVLRTVQRKAGSEVAAEAVAFFEDAGLVSVPPTVELLRRSLEMTHSLRCDLYDACAPALADMLDARLYSADRKAHGRYRDVVLVG
ncbi:MAG: type II toxin-antitoxin system VapC family toxin [Coriobacteriia bacterium]|nr:type II toxin-antitoxin system VapC family toxin [Coriobacteriia bacterium]